MRLSIPFALHGLASVLLAAFLTTGILTPRDTCAYTFVVPDDFPSINQALDELHQHGFYADTVLVRGGTDAEHVVLRIPGAIYVIGVADARGELPRVASVDVDDDRYGGGSEPHAENLHILGYASMPYYDLTWPACFTRCIIDSGVNIVSYSTPGVSVVGCTVTGSIVSCGNLLVDSCWVNGSIAPRSCGSDFPIMNVQHSTVLNEIGGYGPCIIRGNTTSGIAVLGKDGALISILDNVIRPLTGPAGGIWIEAEDCSVAVMENRITDASRGITIDASYGAMVTVRDNVVLGSAEWGMRLDMDLGIVAGNIVGRSGKSGINILNGHDRSGTPEIRNNTVFANREAGIHLDVKAADSVNALTRNIGFGNGSYGLMVANGIAPRLGCNDWFANDSGSVSGVAPSPQDVMVDPEFCDVAHDDVHLTADSPLLDAPGCGLIGALAQGCDSVMTATLVTLFTAEREADHVRLRWQLGDPTRFAEVWVERADVASGPWKRVTTEESTDGGVSVGFDRSALAEREYWYRLAARNDGAVAVISEPLRVEANVARRFALLGVTPNPGSGPLWINVALAREAAVEMAVFDLQGRLVTSLVHGRLTAGAHTIEWSDRSAASGVYLLDYRYPGGHQVRRFVRIR